MNHYIGKNLPILFMINFSTVFVIHSASNWLRGKYQTPFQTGLQKEPVVLKPGQKPFLYGWGRRIKNYGPTPQRKNGKIEGYWLPPNDQGKPNWNHAQLRSRTDIQKYCEYSLIKDCTLEGYEISIWLQEPVETFATV